MTIDMILTSTSTIHLALEAVGRNSEYKVTLQEMKSHKYMQDSRADNVHLSRDMRKPTFCICKNKRVGKLHGSHTADQPLCFG